MVVMVKFVLDREENIVEKGENTDYQHFLLFPQWKANCTFWVPLNLSSTNAFNLDKAKNNLLSNKELKVKF